MADKKFFVSIIYGYFHNLHYLSFEENYHLHALKVAKDMGYKPIAIIKGGEEEIVSDPNYDPDIVVVPYKNFIYFLYQIIKYTFKKSVFYVNSYEWQSFIVPFFSRKAVFMAHTQPKRQNIIKQLIQDFVYKLFWRIRLNNVTEENFLLERNIKKEKLFVVPLIVDSRFFYRKENPDRKNLVYFGNVTAKKNLLTILKALVEVKKEKPDVILNIVGKIADDNFKNMINQLDLSKNIVFHGFTPLDKLADKLNQSLVYVNSSFDEGQCVSVYDAALCGCALCLPNIMSFIGVFKDKALFHDVNDSKKLVEDILYYLNNPQKAGQDNDNCIEMIKNDFNKEIVERRMREIFTLN